MLADTIAEYLAGTGRPLTAEQIAEDLELDETDVHIELILDERFVNNTWTLLVEPEDRDRAGSPPAPRADAATHLEEVARHDPFGMLHSIHVARYRAVRRAVERWVA